MGQHQEQPWTDDSSVVAAKLSGGGSLQPLALPSEPMAPISDDELPVGSDWGYQLKWDGVRILARLDGTGNVELFSRKLYLKNGIYPEMVSLIASKAEKLGRCLLDGEIVWFDGVRPSFQQVLKRERSRSAHMHSSPDAEGTASHGGLVYVLFDLLADESGDLRQLPYEERHRKLLALCPADDPRMFVTELFKDGAALWEWVQTNNWEGVVSKRLSSPYREDKKHRDWLKKKIALVLDVDIVGLKWRNGIVASLIMEYEGGYLGSVSLGLNDALRRVIASTFRPQNSQLAVVPCPFATVPEDLRKEEVQWLSVPFKCRVTGLEFTSAGQLRHPKLVTFLPKEPLS